MSYNKKNNTSKPVAEKRVIFDSFSNNCGYLRMDIAGNINLMDNKAKQILGYQKVKGKLNAKEMIVKEDFPKTMKSFIELYKKGEYINYNARINTSNGEIKRVQIDTKIIYNSSKKPIGAHGVIKEIFDPVVKFK